MSGECAQILPEAIRVSVGEKGLNGTVGSPPDGNGACQQSPPLGRQRHDAATAVCRVHCDLKQTPSL
jgi:hypothetical protein